MKITFPDNTPVIETTKTERDHLRRTETLLRHAALVRTDLVQAADLLKAFVEEQDKQAEVAPEQGAGDSPPAAGNSEAAPPAATTAPAATASDATGARE